MPELALTIIGDQTGIDTIRLKDHLARFGFDGGTVTLERKDKMVLVKETKQQFHILELSPFVVKFSWREFPFGVAVHDSHGALVEDALIVKFTQSELFKELVEDDEIYGDYYSSDHELPVVLINEVKYRLVSGSIDNVLNNFEEVDLPYFYYIKTAFLGLCLKRHEYESIDLGGVLTLQPSIKGWTIHCDTPDYIESEFSDE